MAQMVKIGKGELIIAAGVAGLVLYFYSESKKAVSKVTSTATDAAKYVANKANPLKQENVINTAIQETGRAITQDNNWTAGGQVFDWFAPDHSNDVAYQSGKLSPAQIEAYRKTHK